MQRQFEISTNIRRETVSRRVARINVACLYLVVASALLNIALRNSNVMFVQLVLACMLLINNAENISAKFATIMFLGVAFVLFANILNPALGSALTYVNTLLFILTFKSLRLPAKSLRHILVFTAISIIIYTCLFSREGVEYVLGPVRLNPNVVAIYQYIMTVCAVAWCLMSQRKWVRTLSLAALFVGAYLIYQTQARTSLVALALFAIVLLCKNIKIFANEKSYRMIMLVLWAFVLLITVIYVWLYGVLGDEGLIILGKNLFTGRENVWADAFRYIRESPIFGCGNDGLFIGVFESAHNSLLAIWKTAGIVPMVVFVVLFTFTNSARPASQAQSNFVLKAALIGCLFIAAFETSYTDNNIYIFVLLPLLYNAASTPRSINDRL